MSHTSATTPFSILPPSLLAGVSGVTIARVPKSVGEEWVWTVQFAPDRDPLQECRQIAAFLREQHVEVLAQEIFGLPASAQESVQSAFGPITWPLQWVHAIAEPAPLAGMLLWTIAGVSIEHIEYKGKVVGSLFVDGDIRCLRVAGLQPDTATGTRGQQTREVLEAMEKVLEKCGMTFAHVIRTWFYNEDILAWYDEFNAVRNQFFRERGVFDGLVPASTGIGGPNPRGLALTTGLWAYQPLHGHIEAAALPSPLQCPALEYGSSFSRGAELASPTLRRILVSGTASIEPGGLSVHVDDVDAQIELTMDVVLAILAQRKAKWADVTRGVAYLRHASDLPAWRRWQDRNSANSMPIVVSHNVVCRDDLLFEIELDALVLP